MRNITAVSVFSLFLTALVAQEQLPAPKEKIPNHNYSGYYACDGKTSAGKRYDGVVVIEKVHDVYVVQWTNGSTITNGIGQHVDDLLVVGWKMQGEGGAIGVTVYRLGKDNTLTGTYVSNPGNGKQCTETLNLLRRLTRQEDI